MTMAAASGSAPRFFHTGFVCRDLDRAMAQIAGPAGARAFHVVDVARGRSASESVMRRLALACVNAVMIEILEVEVGASSIYDHALPAEEGIGFHHLGYLVDDDDLWQQLEAGASVYGGVASGGHVPGVLRFMYVDRRSDLGHFVEYVQLEAQGYGLFESEPNNQLQPTGALNDMALIRGPIGGDGE